MVGQQTLDLLILVRIQAWELCAGDVEVVGSQPKAGGPLDQNPTRQPVRIKPMAQGYEPLKYVLQVEPLITIIFLQKQASLS